MTYFNHPRLGTMCLKGCDAPICENNHIPLDNVDSSGYSVDMTYNDRPSDAHYGNHMTSRAARAKYMPAPNDTLATIQHLILRHQRGEVTWEITDEQREMARKYFDYEF